MARILVVDGDAAVSPLISVAMRSRGWVVDITDNGPTAVQLALTGRFSLIILDVDRPVEEGLTILREILSARPEQKVLVLCGDEQAEVGIQTLRLGASDYVVRPFAVDELMGRAFARLQEPSTGDAGWQLRAAGLILDLARRTVTSSNAEFKLSQRESALLACLMSEQGKVVGRQELLEEVWGDMPDAASNVVEVCVRRLRSKLGDDVIETVRNVGYTVRKES